MTVVTARRARNALLLILATLLMLAAFAAFFAVYQGLPASGAPAGLPPAHWLMKKDDLRRAQAVGPMPAFQWVSCGSAQPFALPCVPSATNRVPTFTDYYAFARYVRHGGRGTVLIDYEGWTLTPHWQQTHMGRYIRLADQLAAAHGITAILAPVTGPPDGAPVHMLTADEIAARYGAAVVDIQLQWMTREPDAYRDSVRAWVPRIRAANPHTVVIAGLRLSAPRQGVTVAQAVQSYDELPPVCGRVLDEREHLDGGERRPGVCAAGLPVAGGQVLPADRRQLGVRLRG